MDMGAWCMTIRIHILRLVYPNLYSQFRPIFHTLDAFKGTLIFDEADFRFSDEKAEIVKI